MTPSANILLLDWKSIIKDMSDWGRLKLKWCQWMILVELNEHSFTSLIVNVVTRPAWATQRSHDSCNKICNKLTLSTRTSRRDSDLETWEKRFIYKSSTLHAPISEITWTYTATDPFRSLPVVPVNATKKFISTDWLYHEFWMDFRVLASQVWLTCYYPLAG